MERIKGIAVSAGIAIAPIHHYVSQQVEVVQRSVTEPQTEWQRFEDAIERSQKQLQAIQERRENELDAETLAIFSAHKTLLHDPELHQKIQFSVFENSWNIEFAFTSAVDEYIGIFSQMENAYLRERASDLRDIRQRVLLNLQGEDTGHNPVLNQACILLADDLSPSDTIQLDLQYVRGLCTAKGGGTSHTAILARSSGIPAIVGSGDQIQSIKEGATAILDGTNGELIIDPDASVLEDYEARRKSYLAHFDTLLTESPAPAITQDGKKIVVTGNVNREEDIEPGIQNGAEGIGLLRTEFLYMQSQSLPSEDELTAIYTRIAKQVYPEHVIIRALDIGGDKPLPYLEMPVEENPFLGKRGIRFLLDRKDLLHTGLCAILRANHEVGNIKLMLPMISQIEEVKAIRDEIQHIRESNHSEMATQLEIGIMIETPAAALIADHFASHVDFFSIGTNDLVQYTLAVDRGNESIANLYDARHPSVLRLIALVVDAAHANNILVGVCGDLASDIDGAILLTGLGVDELSVSPSMIPFVKDAIRNLHYTQAVELARTALNQSTAQDVRRLITQVLSTTHYRRDSR